MERINWNSGRMIRSGPPTALLLLALLASACAEGDPAARRAARAARTKGDILVGAGGPWSSPDGEAAWRGLKIALDEINSNGGIGGRKLRIAKLDDEGSVDGGRTAAQAFADDPDMVAVIGHFDSHISVPNSIVYEYNGMLMLSPFSTAPKLTRQGFRRIFRMVPDDTAFGSRLARFAVSRGLERVMIYQVQNEYGTGLANAFERECEVLGISVPDRLSYDSRSDERIFRRDLSFWKENFEFDGMLVAGSVPQAALFVREARGLGIRASILAGDGLDTPEFASLAGESAEGVFVGSVSSPDDERPEAAEFAAGYSRKYGAPPDTNAARLYDAVRLLASAIKESGSAVPDRIAGSLRSMAAWTGAAGDYRFGADGNLSDRDILIKVVRGGKLVPFRRLLEENE
ncbi:MAG: hypothetical protein A2Z99_07785 [Treponema sp. GWB1_62_6]|nr:MAG: hypothetical protein A2001_11285 [Treponema sp. GWC1_61_84]OHE64338.1 MAG: hypothetical protein A2Z99_07785 [Treponema sp. GWB1_62_6]HCM26326.1 branched chain amino acid ABC transporter substrate-binding protein [Treponema sp.]